MPSLPGFRDFYPDDCAARNAIFAKWREVAQRYGFVEYDGPPLEPLDLFTKKSGQEIVGQLYNFTDKGEREVALRPEMTPTLARLVTARHKDFKKPLKWFSVPQVFRYERQQRGRLREHFQFNCDIIGEPGLEADIELIALVIDTLRSFGLQEEDFVVRLSDRQFWTDFMNAKKVPEDQRYAFLQAIDKSERETPEKTAEKLGPLATEVFSILENGAESKRLDTIEKGLGYRGLENYVKRDFTIVRGLAYYTGVVFEVFDRRGEFRAIAAGGRYDTLLKNLGDVDLPALGFGMGDVVLGEMLKTRQLANPRLGGNGVYLVIADEAYRAQAMNVLEYVRGTLRMPVDYSFVPAKVGKQFQTAEERGCDFVVVVDSQIENDIVQVKELITRKQVETNLQFLAATFRQLKEKIVQPE